MPAHPLIVKLAAIKEFPRDAILECRAHRDEITPVFLDILTRAVHGEVEVEEYDALLLIIHLLAEFGDQSAFPILLAFLRKDRDLVDDVLGDAVTMTLSGVLISTFNGDLILLEDLIDDWAVDEYVRAAALDTWTYLAVSGQIDRGYACTYLRECAEFRFPRYPDFIWEIWLTAVGYLGLEDLSDEVRRACADGRIDPTCMDFRDFERGLEESLQPNQDVLELLRRDAIRPFKDTIAEFEAWNWALGMDNGNEGRMTANQPPDTVINPNRHVGRNDPCPCGSGKKFKKCCGG